MLRCSYVSFFFEDFLCFDDFGCLRLLRGLKKFEPLVLVLFEDWLFEDWLFEDWLFEDWLFEEWFFEEWFLEGRPFEEWLFEEWLSSMLRFFAWSASASYNLPCSLVNEGNLRCSRLL